ncbi:hypothetical protein D3C76_955330 [compost metagenome]
MLFQQATEIEEGGSVCKALHAQPSKLAEDGCLVECFLHRRIAVAELALHQMYAHLCVQRIRRTPTITLGIVRAIKPVHDTDRSNSISNISLLRVYLRLPAYSASAKVICFIWILRQRDRRISPALESLFQDFLRRTQVCGGLSPLSSQSRAVECSQFRVRFTASNQS